MLYTVNVEIFAWGNLRVLCDIVFFREKLSHDKIKPQKAYDFIKEIW